MADQLTNDDMPSTTCSACGANAKLTLYADNVPYCSPCFDKMLTGLRERAEKAEATARNFCAAHMGCMFTNCQACRSTMLEERVRFLRRILLALDRATAGDVPITGNEAEEITPTLERFVVLRRERDEARSSAYNHAIGGPDGEAFAAKARRDALLEAAKRIGLVPCVGAQSLSWMTEARNICLRMAEEVSGG